MHCVFAMYLFMFTARSIMLRLVVVFSALAALVSAQWGFTEEWPTYPDSQVVMLTDLNFQSLVLDTQDPYFIEFYAPWCGHCRRLQPLWEDMAKQLSGRTFIAKVDCTENDEIKNKYHVNAYPTMKLFHRGRIFTFEGSRNEDELLRFIDEHRGHAMDKAEVVPKHTLRSFDWRGDAEPIRIALEELGISYEEVRYKTQEEWDAARPGLEQSGQAPFGK